MTDTRDDIVVSFKVHTGYDSPFIAIKGGTAAEVADKIASIEAIGLFATVGNADVAFKAAFNLGSTLGATPVQHPNSVPQPGYAPPIPQAPQQAYAPPQAAPVGPPGMAVPTCMHGTKLYKTGNGAKGVWQAWMCPTPKGTPGQCPPEWVK